MNWLDKIFIATFLGLFLTLAYLVFFDTQKKSLHIQRITLKMQTVQDLIGDLKDLSKNLQVKNIINNLQVSHDPNITFIENSFKLSLVSEAIDIKAQMMSEAIKDALDEVNKPVSYSIV